VNDLIDRIRAAQIDAGERVVMDDLRARGLADIVQAPVRRASFETRVKLMHVVVGMAKDAGYDLEGFIEATRTAWPHVPGPVRATYCRHCPCPEWEPL
jgi:hypothetical protein